MSQKSGSNGHSAFRISADSIAQEASGEVILLRFRNGVFYALDSLGARVWQLLCHHADPEEALSVLLDEYGVSEEQLRQDLEELLAGL